VINLALRAAHLTAIMLLVHLVIINIVIIGELYIKLYIIFEAS